ncbi:MAG: adenosine deaminase [Chloroflexi bacterium]|nr:adenosine deaminase [Chloroflexota bacterium]
MPKAELHLHLDGCLRLETIAELAAQQGVQLPVPAERLAEVCVAPEACRDLLEVLSYFSLPVSVLQTAGSLERATYELCEDLRRENVRYAEIRFAPILHRERGMGLAEILEAVVRGWRTGREAFGLAGGIILCGLRHLPPEDTLEVARAGLPFLGNGVVGFDLAGDEAHFPILLHREPLRWAKDAGYGMTAHAGEAAGAESVRDAVEVVGVSRVGHGVRAGEDPALLSVLRDRRITLEMCPTSNNQTHSVPSLAGHPLARYYRDGVRVTINTDNRTVAGTTMTREMALCHEEMNLTLRELAALTLTAVEAGFADKAERRRVVEEMESEMVGLL